MVESTFRLNVAIKGGIIDTNNAIIKIRRSQLSENYAQEGSVLHVLANSPSQQILDRSAIPLQILDSRIERNWAISNMVKLQGYQLLIDNCQIIDNEAKFVTHGFQLNQADLYIENSEIYFTDALTQKLLGQRNSKVDSGFFNLILESQLFLSSTKITGLVSKRQAVLNSSMKSSVTLSDNV